MTYIKQHALTISLGGDGKQDGFTKLSQEVQSIYDAINQHNHNGTNGSSITASDITNSAAGNLSSTNVQDAINELDTEKIKIPASIAQGDIIYRGASDFERLPAGTSGQLLKTFGSGSNPGWFTPNYAPSGYGLGGLSAFTGTDMNDLVYAGFYYVTNTHANRPADYCNVVVTGGSSATDIITQYATCVTTNITYVRSRTNSGGWTAWQQTMSDSAHSFSSNGYQKFSNGLILQWGNVAGPASNATVNITFPIAFPNNVLNCTASFVAISGVSDRPITINSYSTTGMSIHMVSGASVSGTTSSFWLAIGY